MLALVGSGQAARQEDAPVAFEEQSAMRHAPGPQQQERVGEVVLREPLREEASD